MSIRCQRRSLGSFPRGWAAVEVNAAWGAGVAACGPNEHRSLRSPILANPHRSKALRCLLEALNASVSSPAPYKTSLTCDEQSGRIPGHAAELLGARSGARRAALRAHRRGEAAGLLRVAGRSPDDTFFW